MLFCIQTHKVRVCTSIILPSIRNPSVWHPSVYQAIFSQTSERNLTKICYRTSFHGKGVREHLSISHAISNINNKWGDWLWCTIDCTFQCELVFESLENSMPHGVPLFYRRQKRHPTPPKLSPLAPWPDAMIKPQWLTNGQNKFSRWLPSWISNGTILAIYDQQVTLILPVKFRVTWPWGLAVVFWTKLLMPHNRHWLMTIGHWALHAQVSK